MGESTTTKSSQLSSQQSQDKGKGIMVEEPVKTMKKKDLIRLDEETAKRLQAKFDEEERLAREKAEKEQEANIALIETRDDIQAKIDVDHQLAERLQAQEQEELSDAEKATLFQQLLEKRRNHFVAKRAEEKRNKPPTKAQQRQIMCTYLTQEHEVTKLKIEKSKGFDSIQEMFDRAFKMVNTFEDFRTKLVEGKEKRAGEELIQDSLKKQKVDDDKEITKLKQCLEIIPDDEKVTIDAIPLAVKSPRIKSYYQIIRANRKSQIYIIISHMLKSFNMEDLEILYKLVKVKYESTRPVEDLDLLLWVSAAHGLQRKYAKTSKDIKKVDVWDSLTKNFIRSFKMSFHNGGSVLSVARSGYTSQTSIVLRRQLLKACSLQLSLKDLKKHEGATQLESRSLESLQTLSAEEKERRTVTNFDEDVDIWHSMWTMSFEADNVMLLTLMLMRLPQHRTKSKINETYIVEHMDEYQEEHEMQSDVQRHNYVVDSDGLTIRVIVIIIPYDQYWWKTTKTSCTNNVSSVTKCALMSILDEYAMNKCPRVNVTTKQ
ncbi:hypothetical protein Tco_0847676 [Tanacetum coccineum]